MCTVGLYVSLCLMIFLCPFLHCKALRTAMYKRYINSIIIIIIIIIIISSLTAASIFTLFSFATFLMALDGLHTFPKPTAHPKSDTLSKTV